MLSALDKRSLFVLNRKLKYEFHVFKLWANFVTYTFTNGWKRKISFPPVCEKDNSRTDDRISLKIGTSFFDGTLAYQSIW